MGGPRPSDKFIREFIANREKRKLDAKCVKCGNYIYVRDEDAKDVVEDKKIIGFCYHCWGKRCYWCGAEIEHRPDIFGETKNLYVCKGPSKHILND